MLGFSTVLGIIAPLLSLPFGEALCFANGNLEALQMIRTFKVEALSLMVAQLQGFLQVLGSEPPPPSLRIVVVGGSRIAPAMLRAARAKLCSNIAFGYGSTEMGNITGGSGDSLERAEGSAGYVRPWIEMQVVDANGNEVPRGTDGIIRVRSPEMAAYADDAADPVETIRDGWFYPGDVGTIQADGLITVTGRSAELINRGGSIVSPDLVESVLTMHPSVKEAVAFGLPTKTGIDEIYAVVVAPDRFNEAELLHFCRERLADKAPGAIRRLDAIPRTDSGKPKRRQVREQIMAAQQGA
jgi:acyl-coenzyme A synthetase/AMP-(fatty) acid ligase